MTVVPQEARRQQESVVMFEAKPLHESFCISHLCLDDQDFAKSAVILLTNTVMNVLPSPRAQATSSILLRFRIQCSEGAQLSPAYRQAKLTEARSRVVSGEGKDHDSELFMLFGFFLGCVIFLLARLSVCEVICLALTK